MIIQKLKTDVISYKKTTDEVSSLQLPQTDEKQSSGGQGCPKPRRATGMSQRRDDSFSSGKAYCNRHVIWFSVTDNISFCLDNQMRRCPPWEYISIFIYTF